MQDKFGFMWFGTANGLNRYDGYNINVYEAGATSIAADTRFTVGEPDSGYAGLHRSLALIRPYRTSVQLHNLIVSAATRGAQSTRM